MYLVAYQRNNFGDGRAFYAIVLLSSYLLDCWYLGKEGQEDKEDLSGGGRFVLDANVSSLLGTRFLSEGQKLFVLKF